MSTLMRQELALAKAELRESAKKPARAGAELGAGVYAGHMTILFLSIAFWCALGRSSATAGRALVMAVIWGDRRRDPDRRRPQEHEEGQGAPQTVDTLKEIPEALKRNEENR